MSASPNPAILMCPPEFYGIEYEINPWMSRSRDADRDRAARQWQELHETIVSLGCTVKLIEPVEGLPDMVFTANAGLVYEKTFVSSRFRHAVRAQESNHFEPWFELHAFEIRVMPIEHYFEGAGDALFCGNSLFGGYRIRSDARSHHHLASLLGVQALPLELVNPRFYHLDTCFCPIERDRAIWFPAAFDDYGQKVIRANVPQLIEVEESEAHRFGCNAVVIGRSVILPSPCPKLARELEGDGFSPIELELDEFLKAGGSAKCMTLRIDGEDAAGWRR